MDKYDGLYNYLKSPRLPTPLTLTIAQITRILKIRRLPDSAYIRSAWWGNNSNRHVQAVWLQAGWKARPNWRAVPKSNIRIVTSVTFTR